MLCVGDDEFFDPPHQKPVRSVEDVTTYWTVTVFEDPTETSPSWDYAGN